MNQIDLLDNRFGLNAYSVSVGKTTSEVVITKPKCDNPNNTEKFTVKDKNALDFLNQVSQQKAKDLCTENPDLIIFSNDEQIDGFESNDSYILKFRDTNGKKYIETSNLMGFFGSGSLLIRIKSRFSPNDDKDLFLHYMLNKVFHFNFIKWETSCGNTSVFDFLLLCFPYYLKKACKKGLFKQYVHREYNDANVRGVINVNRHIRKNIPFAGKIAYRTREFSTDNPVTQLIRHTIEYIRQTSFGKSLLSSDNDVKDYVSQICMATPSYNHNALQKVLADNNHPVRHPFFTEFATLQKVCRMILMHRKNSYQNNDNHKIYGILFDGAWLWEEYVNTILNKLKFQHPENKTRQGGIYLFQENENQEDEDKIETRAGCKRYPDFYRPRNKDKDEGSDIILDAKYKNLEDKSIDRDDMHQIISYMHVEKAILGGVLFPRQKSNNPNSINKTIGTLRGYGGTILSFGMPIPQITKEEPIELFAKNMEVNEKKLLKQISEEF